MGLGGWGILGEVFKSGHTMAVTDLKERLDGLAGTLGGSPWGEARLVWNVHLRA